MSKRMPYALIVGTRPNFVKAAAVVRALAVRGVPLLLIHTGQHFDAQLSDVFFQRLGLPQPDHHLGVGAGSRGEQFGEITRRLSGLFAEHRPQEVIVVGDVTSTAAAAVAADSCDIPVIHVEAGLRSFDKTMPEERNRLIVDALARRHLVSEPAGVANLLREGHSSDTVHLVGNVMIDTLYRFRDEARAAAPWTRHEVRERGYAVATLHRPANVDTPEALRGSLEVLSLVAARVPVLFAAPPRTQARLKELGVPVPTEIRVLPPLEYLEFVGLMGGARVVLTDSGGAQEETTALGVPCLTMRENTERPITVEQGSSRLIGRSTALARQYLDEIDAGTYAPGRPIELWDGHAAERIADLLAR
jgi:UDP-N-acetylglucosamine 2-epimerase (non-hydrolysing)